MKSIPVVKCKDMQESLQFYTAVLDFELVVAWPTTSHPTFCVIRKDETELRLSSHAGDDVSGNVVYFAVNNVRVLFEKFLSRGVNTMVKMESQVHESLIDQSSEWRELYVTDPSGNTLRFGQDLYEGGYES